ncbi:hypothetical protein [Streptomyces sp. NPDC003710]
MNAWQICTTLSSRIMQAADRIPGERTDRHQRYRNWSMDPATADSLLRTLLALSIHTLIMDTARNEKPYTPDMVERIRLTDISDAATQRPPHELLAGLTTLTDEDQLRVNAIKILIYDEASALPLARLSQMIRITLMRLAATSPNKDPVCSDVTG